MTLVPHIRVRSASVFALALVGCRPIPVDSPAPDSGPADTSEPELIPYVAKDICVVGDGACAHLDDGGVACWSSWGAIFLDVIAERMSCYNGICAETDSGAISCYDWFGEASPEYAPPAEILPLTEWWDARWHLMGGCGVQEALQALCWPTSWGWTEMMAAYQVRHIGFTEPCILLTDTSGRIHSFWEGENCAGQEPDPHYGGGSYGLETPPAGDDWQSVSGGKYHACALDSEGRVTCWGLAADQLQPDPDLRFSQIDSANHVNCGVTTDAHIACWGNSDKHIPSDVPTTAGWVQVGVSEGRACALDQDGQVHCFGDWDETYTLNDALLEAGK